MIFYKNRKLMQQRSITSSFTRKSDQLGYKYINISSGFAPIAALRATKKHNLRFTGSITVDV